MNESLSSIFVWMNVVIYINSCYGSSMVKIYIYIYIFVLFLLIQLLFVGSIFHLALFVLRLASWFYILSSFFCLTFHLSKDWIVLVGFWFSSLNWTNMLYKAFPSSMTWTSMPKFFPCFTQENLLTLHLYVQRIYSSWIF